MIAEKKGVLGSLIESANQIHLTIYLLNQGDLNDLKRQIQESLSEANEALEPVLADALRKELLLPIEALLEDPQVLKQLKGNIGIFRTKAAFRILSLPIEVRRSCHVASTFHVKPLIRWMQTDLEFLLLGLGSDSAHLYFGSQESLRKLDSILYPARMTRLFEEREMLGRGKLRELKSLAKQTFSWISDWIEKSVPLGKLGLFVAGEDYLTECFNRVQRFDRAVQTPIASYFSEEIAQEVVQKTRHFQRDAARSRLERALLTFQVADRMSLAKDNIREIAKAATLGRVTKLMIAENREIFGKLDPKTGKVVIHPFDLDHEDDDLLDDLAQCVLKSGGEVYVVNNENMPRRWPILAILDNEKMPAPQQMGLSVQAHMQK